MEDNVNIPYTILVIIFEDESDVDRKGSPFFAAFFVPAQTVSVKEPYFAQLCTLMLLQIYHFCRVHVQLNVLFIQVHVEIFQYMYVSMLHDANRLQYSLKSNHYTVLNGKSSWL